MLQYSQKNDLFFSSDETHIGLSFLQYSLQVSGILFIKNIEVSSNTKLRYPHIHHGTELFNHFLIHLQDSEIYFNKICGVLTWPDAERGNWTKSIAFYYDFCKHIHPKLNYNLKFHLYSNENYSSEVLIPSEKSERQNFIEAFQLSHLQPLSNASFMYISE